MPVEDWTPNSEAVAAILRARTKNHLGTELGAFTADTRPTTDQVSAMIGEAVSQVAADHGSDITEPLWPQAKRLVTLEAALLVELSYFPEQVAANRSPYEQLKELRDRALATLTHGIMELASGGALGSGDNDRLPVHTFPEDAGGMIGWGTRW